jgi:hypothetical protein
MTDKLWSPSAFEVTYMGYDKDEGERDGWFRDWTNPATEVVSNSVDSSMGWETRSTTRPNYNRYGLWEMTAYDRAHWRNPQLTTPSGQPTGTNAYAWLRSGSSIAASHARSVTYNGDGWGNAGGAVSLVLGVRPALHLSFSDLASVGQSGSNVSVQVSSGEQIVGDVNSVGTVFGDVTYMFTGTVREYAAVSYAGYDFVRWEVSGTGSSVSNVTSPTIIFTKGSEDATLTAIFEEVKTSSAGGQGPGTTDPTDEKDGTDDNANISKTKAKISAEWIWIPVVLGTLIVLLTCLMFEYHRRKRVFSEKEADDE